MFAQKNTVIVDVKEFWDSVHLLRREHNRKRKRKSVIDPPLTPTFIHHHKGT